MQASTMFPALGEGTTIWMKRLTRKAAYDPSGAPCALGAPSACVRALMVMREHVCNVRVDETHHSGFMTQIGNAYQVHATVSCCACEDGMG